MKFQDSTILHAEGFVKPQQLVHFSDKSDGFYKNVLNYFFMPEHLLRYNITVLAATVRRVSNVECQDESAITFLVP